MQVQHTYQYLYIYISVISHLINLRFIAFLYDYTFARQNVNK